MSIKTQVERALRTAGHARADRRAPVWRPSYGYTVNTGKDDSYVVVTARYPVNDPERERAARISYIMTLHKAGFAVEPIGGERLPGLRVSRPGVGVAGLPPPLIAEVVNDGYSILAAEQTAEVPKTYRLTVVDLATNEITTRVYRETYRWQRFP